jgi:hypothetical protein
MPVADPPAPLLLRPRDAARVLGISERLLWSISAPRGPLAVVRVHRAVRYSTDELRRYIAAAQQQGARP